MLHPFKEKDEAQVVNGLGSYNPDYFASSFSFAMFSHYRRRGERAVLGTKVGGDDTASVRSALRRAGSMAEAVVVVCGASKYIRATLT